jgi:hypothetical protein
MMDSTALHVDGRSSPTHIESYFGQRFDACVALQGFGDHTKQGPFTSLFATDLQTLQEFCLKHGGVAKDHVGLMDPIDVWTIGKVVAVEFQHGRRKSAGLAGFCG